MSELKRDRKSGHAELSQSHMRGDVMSDGQEKAGQIKCHECGQTFKSDHELREHNEKMHKDKAQHAGQGQGQHQHSGGQSSR